MLSALLFSFAGKQSSSSAFFPPSGAVWKPGANGSWDTPILRADPLTWEKSAVQEPQVLSWPAGSTTSLRMWYRGAGWGSPSGVGVADSTDGGVTWSKHPSNPVYVGGDAVSSSCAGQPWVVREAADRWWLFTTNNHPPRTCIAFSADGVNWRNASRSAATAVPLPPNGTLFGNRAVWYSKEKLLWEMLQECGTTSGVWQIFLYTCTAKGSSESGPNGTWVVGNRGAPLTQLQRHPHSMYGGPSIVHVDGIPTPRDPSDGLYHVWYHAGANGNLPTDIYHATSPDLLDWTVSPSIPVVTHQGSGSFAFDQVADPSPLTVGESAFLFYDGDNNGAGVKTHAAIGLAVARAASPGGGLK